MAGGGEGGRTLEETPTWAVALVCSVLLTISILIEFTIHLTDKWLTKRNRSALCEALEKIKSEFMLLGFISLLLTIGQGTISDICISKSVASTWHPCERNEKITEYQDYARINGTVRRLLAAGGTDKCAQKEKVSLVSVDGIHQLHIFIFVLAIFHVLYCIATCALGTIKMRKWKTWEMETKTSEYQFANDPERFRFARDTSFGRRHLNFWSRSPILMWMVCFVRQFIRSVPKVDYLTLRYGFIIAHLAPQSQANFDFQKYINRSLEEDFKVVVGISPPIWFFAVLFLLFNTQGSPSYIWLPFIPLVIILLVGTKLQVAITKMGLRIQERGEVVKGTPVVQLDDDLFWFNRPRILLYLIHFVFFQNAFQLAFYLWSWYEFGVKSCFHQRKLDVIIRVTMGVVVLFLCGYVILPLYALVTQMGSTMKSTIFNEKVAKALRTWHNNARKQIKQQKHPSTPLSSQPGTPVHGSSPIQLQHQRYRAVDIVPIEPQEAEVISDTMRHDLIQNHDGECSETHVFQHEVDIIQPAEFSFVNSKVKAIEDSLQNGR